MSKTKSKNELWYIGLLRIVKSSFIGRWRLENKIAELQFRLDMRDVEIVDLNNRLEAYKDVLGALSRKSQLEGMIFENDLEKISQVKKGISNE